MATSDVELRTGNGIEHTVLQVLLDCKKNGQDVGNGGLPLIFMVHSVHRDSCPRSFNPMMVSIGPLLKQDKNVQELEALKKTYLHLFLDGLSSMPEQMLQECVLKVSSTIKEIKACYAKSITIYKDEEIAKMMVIDGCFILYVIQLLSKNDEQMINMLLAPPILFDLLLIENQIPFFVLKDIFESTILKKYPNTSVIEHVLELRSCHELFRDGLVGHNVSLNTTDHDHILGLLHKSLQPAHNIQSGSGVDPKRHSAMELDRAGVRFMPYQDVNWAMAMKLEFIPRFSCFPWFWRKPTLMMPMLHIDDVTERILKNLIIYEQSSPVPNYVTAYAWAMGMLMETPRDVDKLVKSGVIGTIRSNEFAVNMISNICKEVLYTEFPYFQEWEELDTYYNSYWPNAVAGLKRTYFGSPWNMIAMFAGIVLFILTVVQTIFTVMKP